MDANYQHEDRSSILQTFLPLIMSMEHGKLLGVFMRNRTIDLPKATETLW